MADRDQYAVGFAVQARHADVVGQFAADNQVGQATLVVKRLACDSWIVNQFFTNLFAEVFVVRQFFHDVVVVAQLAYITHAVDQDDFRSVRTRPDRG